MCPKPWWFISWWRERHVFLQLVQIPLKYFASNLITLSYLAHTPHLPHHQLLICMQLVTLVPTLLHSSEPDFSLSFCLCTVLSHALLVQLGRGSVSQQLDVLVLGLSSEAWLLALGVGVMRAGTLGLGVLASRSCSKRMSVACCAFSVAKRWAGRALKPAVSCSTRCSKLNIWRSRSSLRSFSSDMSSYITLCIYTSPRERRIERHRQMAREMMRGEKRRGKKKRKWDRDLRGKRDMEKNK